jgi:hypothetical protein
MNCGTTGLTLCHGAFAHQLVRAGTALRAGGAPRRGLQYAKIALDILTII